jgi:hypothetical protein
MYCILGKKTRRLSSFGNKHSYALELKGLHTQLLTDSRSYAGILFDSDHRRGELKRQRNTVLHAMRRKARSTKTRLDRLGSDVANLMTMADVWYATQPNSMSISRIISENNSVTLLEKGCRKAVTTGTYYSRSSSVWLLISGWLSERVRRYTGRVLTTLHCNGYLISCGRSSTWPDVMEQLFDLVWRNQLLWNTNSVCSVRTTTWQDGTHS